MNLINGSVHYGMLVTTGGRVGCRFGLQTEEASMNRIRGNDDPAGKTMTRN